MPEIQLPQTAFPFEFCCLQQQSHDRLKFSDGPVLKTCQLKALNLNAGAAINRFTDGLRLPSEDEAVKIYQETYRPGTYRTDWREGVIQ